MTTPTGLVFAGQTKSSEFDALAGSTGQKLWASPPLLNAKGVTAPSITYTVGGKQYVGISSATTSTPSASTAEGLIR